jgi:hypothetical protein
MPQAPKQHTLNGRLRVRGSCEASDGVRDDGVAYEAREALVAGGTELLERENREDEVLVVLEWVWREAVTMSISR